MGIITPQVFHDGHHTQNLSSNFFSKMLLFDTIFFKAQSFQGVDFTFSGTVLAVLSESELSKRAF